MAKQKGSPKTGGRQKGTPNKSTEKIRNAFGQLVENNLDNIANWLNQVAKNNPTEALKMMHQFAQYSVPLLARQELTGDGAELNPPQFVIELNETKPKAN
jgi:hypothetical protein